jgi:hypothetical protein
MLQAMPKECPSSAQAVLEQSSSRAGPTRGGLFDTRADARRRKVCSPRYFGPLDHGQRVSGGTRSFQAASKTRSSSGEQRRPEPGWRPRMTDNPMHPGETGQVAQTVRCGAKTRSGAPSCRRRSPGGGGAAQTAAARRKDRRTATTSMADIPKRWLPPAVGYAMPLK